jgi:hypothetical protein
MLLLLREQKEQSSCLFLRAFRSDAASEKLRTWLKAALGKRFKLSGIRPPAERASTGTSLFSPLVTGLRYLGSRQFELEAPDRNWLARLLASFAETRMVFIDVRDVTPNVLDEIQLAWRVFGPSRTVFIIDEKSSRDHWAATISRDLKLKDSPDGIHMLEWPSNNSPSAAFVSETSRIVATIQEGSAQVSADAIAFAYEKVGEANWDRTLVESEGGMIALSLVVTTGVWMIVDFSFLVAASFSWLRSFWAYKCCIGRRGTAPRNNANSHCRLMPLKLLPVDDCGDLPS